MGPVISDLLPLAIGVAISPVPMIAVILMLLAALASGSAEIVTSAALVLVFVLVTSPLSGHAIAQAARRRPARRDIPPADASTPG